MKIETTAEKIRKYRKKAGLTQKELAKRLEPEVTQVQISEYETGKRIPRQDTIGRIADALGVPFLSLFETVEPETPEELEEIKQRKIQMGVGRSSHYVLTADFGDGMKEYPLNDDGIASGWVTSKDEVIRDLSEMNEAGHEAMLQFSRIIKTHPEYKKDANQQKLPTDAES